MSRNAWVIVVAVVLLLMVVGYATGWFSAEVEAPSVEAPPAATTAPTPAPGGTTQP